MAFQRGTLVHDPKYVDIQELISARVEVAEDKSDKPHVERSDEDSVAFLAKELHDGVAQELWYLHSELECLVNKLAEAQPQLREDVVRLRNVASEAYQEIRGTLRRLYSREQDSVDLINELKSVAEKFSGCVEMDVDFHSTAPVGSIQVSSDVGKQVCRLIQEAMWNSWRHSMSNKVIVSVSQGTNDEGLIIKAADNGCGFLTSNGVESGHYGLRNMQERAKEINGELELDSNLGEGTVVTLRLPL